MLVGGAITILKNMSSSMGRMTSHILSKIKNMFPTTNQDQDRKIGCTTVDNLMMPALVS